MLKCAFGPAGRGVRLCSSHSLPVDSVSCAALSDQVSVTPQGEPIAGGAARLPFFAPLSPPAVNQAPSFDFA